MKGHSLQDRVETCILAMIDDKLVYSLELAWMNIKILELIFCFFCWAVN